MVDCTGVGVGVVRTETLDDFAVTRRAAVCYYDVVESVVFVTMTSQTNLCCHLDFCFCGLQLHELPARVNKSLVLFTRKSVQSYCFFLVYANKICFFRFFLVLLQRILG